jgi:UDP-N-acetylmuramate--alanine ligase
VRAILKDVARPMLTYGIRTDADLRAEDVRWDGGRMRFRAVGAGGAPMTVTLNLPGEHNVLNALAAIAVGREVGAPDEAIAKALASFAGVDRRFQRYGEIALPGGGRFALVDDYGHHPAEMAATLAAVRGAFPGRRLLLAFQPHRFTRTRDLFEDFVRVLSGADALVLTEVYAAGEAPIVAADGRSLARAVRVAGKVEPVFVEGVAHMAEAVLSAVRDGDVVLTQGAGSIGGLAAQLARGTPRAGVVELRGRGA